MDDVERFAHHTPNPKDGVPMNTHACTVTPKTTRAKTYAEILAALLLLALGTSLFMPTEGAASSPEATSCIAPGGWRYTNPIPTCGDFNGIAHGGGRTVLVGDDGLVFSNSEDGAYRFRDSGTTERLTDITWSGDRFIAVGDNVITTSQDGRYWHAQSRSESLYAIAFNGTRFVAGAWGSVLVSPDAETWTSITVPDLSIPLEILWAGDMFVLADQDDAVFTSQDGETWTERHRSENLNLSGGLAWSGEAFVAMANEGYLTSTDGLAWTEHYWADTTFYAPGLAWNGSLFVSAGVYYDDLGTGTGAILTTDGTFSWQWRRWSHPCGFRDAAWTGDRFMVVGDAGAWLASADGITWSDWSSSATRLDLNDAVDADGTFIAVGDGGTVITGPEGASWALRTTPIDEHLYGAAWNGTTAVAVGAHGTIITSQDGITWTAQTSSTSRALYDVIWDGALFTAVGGDDDPATPTPAVVLTSPAGISWTSRDAGKSGLLRTIAWNGTRYAAVGSLTQEVQGDGYTSERSTGLYVTSTDGITWSATDGETGSELMTVSWTGTEFLAADSSFLYRSQDGTQWTRELAPLSGISTVEARDGKILMVGHLGATFSSSDGTNWHEEIVPFCDTWGTALNGIALGDGRSVVVGDGGAVLRNNTYYSDLRVELSAVPDPVEAGTDTVVTVTVTNDGPVDATDVYLRVTVPAGVTVSSVIPARGTAEQDGLTVTAALGDCAVGQSVTVDITMTPLQSELFMPEASTASIETRVKASAEESYAHSPGNTATLRTTVYIYDLDEDGVPWDQDNAPAVYNPGQEDFDGDGIGDVADPDDDEDGMPDEFETLYGLDPLDAADAALDPDGDGYTNLQECQAGSNPTSASSRPAAVIERGFVWVNPFPPGEHLRAVTQGGGVTLALSEEGSVLTSTDQGLTWTHSHTGVQEEFLDVVWGEGLFVAVGRKGYLITSPDGIQWTRRSSGTAQDLEGIAWNGETYVGMGNGFGAAYSGSEYVFVTSPDGESWTTHTRERIASDTSLHGVAWGNGTFVAVGGGLYSSAVLTSTDGAAWTVRSAGGGSTAPGYRVQRLAFRGGGGDGLPLGIPRGHEHGRGRLVGPQLRKPRGSLRGCMGRLPIRGGRKLLLQRHHRGYSDRHEPRRPDMDQTRFRSDRLPVRRHPHRQPLRGGGHERRPDGERGRRLLEFTSYR